MAQVFIFSHVFLCYTALLVELQVLNQFLCRLDLQYLDIIYLNNRE